MSNLGVLTVVAVADIDGVMVDFDKLRVYRAASRYGSGSLITTHTLVDGTTAYTYQDTAGTSTDWYYYTYYNSSSTNESQASGRWAATTTPVVTRAEIRQRAAAYMDAYLLPHGDYTFPGASGTTTGAGSSTTVVCSTYADSLVASRDYRNIYLLLTSGSYAGQERRVTTFAEGSGTFTVSRAYGGTTGNSVTFEGYKLAETAMWNREINEALLDVFTPFQIVIGGIQDRTTYTLPSYVEKESWIDTVNRQTGDDLYEHGLLAKRDFEVTEMPGGGVDLYFAHGLGANQVYIVRGVRHPDPINPAYAGDTSTFSLSDERQQQLVLTTVTNIAGKIARGGFSGLVEDRSQWEKKYQMYERERARWARRIGLREQPGPVRSGWLSVSAGYGRRPGGVSW